MSRLPLRALARTIKPRARAVRLDGRSIAELPNDPISALPPFEGGAVAVD